MTGYRLSPGAVTGSTSTRGPAMDEDAVAACYELDDPELFWPTGETNSEDRKQIREAKAVCRSCPILDACLRYALDNEPDVGIWGGMTGDERAASRGWRRNAMGTAPKAPKARAGCGKSGGYRNHYKYGEEPCEPCRIARRQPAACGTRSGYERHRRLHEELCDACREADAAAKRAAYAKRDRAS
jgi:WhiB family redox-sensing transcriptional regulator